MIHILVRDHNCISTSGHHQSCLGRTPSNRLKKAFGNTCRLLHLVEIILWVSICRAAIDKVT